MWVKGLLVLLACTAVHQSRVSASIVFGDDFSYPDGALVQVCAGKWKTHSGTAAQIQVTSGQVHLSQTKSEDVSVLFPGGTMAWTNTAGLYARFDLEFQSVPSGATGGYFAHFKDASATTGIRCRTFATTNGAAPGCFRLGIASAASAASALLPDDLQLHTRYRVVCRMLLGNNACALWLNPIAETDTCVTSTDEPTVKNAAGFALRQSVTSSGGMGELTVDNLVIATSFEEVVERGEPKPRGLALTISWRAETGIQLSWPAEASRTYSVWACESLEAGFFELASGLCFSDESAVFEDGFPESAVRLYQVRSP